MLTEYDPGSLTSIQEDEFLPPIGRWTRFGGLFIVAAVALAISVASVTKYKETIKTKAYIRPQGKLRLVQAATEGQITSIAVENNQTVRKGDEIATLDDSRLQTQKSQLKDSIQRVQLQLVQMNAQINALDRQILAESDRIDSSVAAAQSSLFRVQREYQDKLITTQAQVRETESALKAAQAALKAAQAKQKRYHSVAQLGAISQDQLQEIQLAAQQQQQTVEATRVKLTANQAALNPSDAEVAIAMSRIAEVEAMGATSLATLNREKKALIQQKIELDRQLSKDSQELQQTYIDLQHTIITAPTYGIVSQLNLRNSGQNVHPGEEIAKIVPSNAKLMIQASVPAKSIGKLERGQTAKMRVSACSYADYGILEGTVTAISPDTVVPQANNSNISSPDSTTQQRAAFYEVAISPDRTSLGQEGDRCAVQLGMEGQVDIVTKEETVLRFLLRKSRLATNL